MAFQEKILTLKRELAENSFSSLGGIPSFETIRQNAWLAFHGFKPLLQKRQN